MQLSTNNPGSSVDSIKLLTSEIASMLKDGSLCPVDGKAYFHIIELIKQAEALHKN